MSTGKGYWLLALDGGIFSSRGREFYGSTGNRRLNQPINGMERTDDDRGYWLVAYDGGIFSFGNATFHGSTGAMRPQSTRAWYGAHGVGEGVLAVREGRRIFTFGGAKFYGRSEGQHIVADYRHAAHSDRQGLLDADRERAGVRLR